ncbi:MAG: leucyl aminopeptidase [Alphaproteobacteria bacterium]|nr:leucyl aminopeptidase [Alphaproteobacteria bacterium]
MDVRFSSASPAEAAVDLLVIGAQGDLATALAPLGDYGKRLAAHLADRSFDTSNGGAVVVPSLGGVAAAQVAVLGLGDGSRAALAKAAGKAGQLARDQKATTVALSLGALDAAGVRDVLEYVRVGNYFYERYLPEKQRRPGIATLTVLGADEAAGSVQEAAVRARYQAWARDLVNAPADVIYPESLAKEASDTLGGLKHVDLEVWDLARCIQEGLAGIEAVGRGSARPGVLIHGTYRPPNATEHIALVGKGVTFDSGGLSLKPSDAMMTMRCDMGGAATALAAFGAIAELGLPIAVDVFVPSVENMNSGSSYKLGDVITYRNGVTVEVHNTDAEGRLILADALCLASEVKGISRIVDMATLTGAILVSLGPDYTGLFTTDDGLAGELGAAFEASSEKAWRMPLDPAYNRLLKGTWGQIKNVGGRNAGSITAGLFLKHFVSDSKRWAHLDIAGTAFADHAVEPYTKGGTGQVVRTLVTWAASLGG